MIADKLIRQAEWVICTTWNQMRSSKDDETYTETDVDNFVEILFRECAENLGVKYNDIKDVLYGRNIEFFETKARFFNEYDLLEPEDDIWKEFKKLLTIPKYIANSANPVARFFENFEQLNLEDRITVLQQLNSTNIKLPTAPIGSEYESFLKTFDKMKKEDQYLFVKNIIHARINILD